MNHALQKSLQYAKNNIIVKNTLSLGAGQILTKIISLISIPIIARMLGVNGFGEYSLIFSFVVLFGGLSDWGIHQLTMREVAREKESRDIYYSNTLLLRILLALLFYFILIISVSLLNYPEKITYLVAILGLIIFANAIINTYVSIINAQEQMNFSATILFVQSLLIPISVIPLLFLEYDLKTIFLILVSLNLLLAIIAGYFFSKKFFVFKIGQIKFYIWKRIVKLSWPYALITLFWMIYANNGSIILSKVSDVEQVGLYNAGMKLILAFLFIPASLMLALFPRMSRQMIDDNKIKIKHSCEKAIKILLIIALPISAFLFIFSNQIISILYGEGFESASSVLRVLSVVLVLLYINSALNYAITSSDKIKNYIIYDFVLVFINIIFGIILSINYGFIGPAIAILVTELLTIFIRLVFISNKLHFKLNIHNILFLKSKSQ